MESSRSPLGSQRLRLRSLAAASAAAAATGGAHKTAFCAGNTKIDKAGASVMSEAGFLKVLKDNKAALSAMNKNLPSGTVGTDARKEVAAAQAAIASGNVNDLNTVPQSAGGDIDTYCGTDQEGNHLPAYFATGKGSSFCTTFLPIYDAVSNSNGSAGALAALESNKAKLPSSLLKSPDCPLPSRPRPPQRSAMPKPP